jgi:hypothetical protein
MIFKLKEIRKYRVRPGRRVHWDVAPDDKVPFDKKEDA